MLIPRPETEIFPDLVASCLGEKPELALSPWADLGTGSGAIAIGAAKELVRVNKVKAGRERVCFAAFSACKRGEMERCIEG